MHRDTNPSNHGHSCVEGLDHAGAVEGARSSHLIIVSTREKMIGPAAPRLGRLLTGALLAIVFFRVVCLLTRDGAIPLLGVVPEKPQAGFVSGASSQKLCVPKRSVPVE
jgi:hypothetical protein